VTTAYDGSIRATDLATRVSHELHLDDGKPSAIDVDTATGSGAGGGGFTFFVGNRGEGEDCEGADLYHLDTRTPTARTAVLRNAHDKKISTLSLAAPGGPYVLTASGDCTVKIWDARKLPGREGGGGGGGGARGRTKAVVTLEHVQGVTSAYFSPDGTKVLSCCNDNKLRVFDFSGGVVEVDGEGPAPVASVYHNNHTGRWLTPMKAVWDVAGGSDAFLCGDMTRGVNLYSARSLAAGESAKDEATLAGELLTAVPTQVAAHASVRAVVGGTASGRVYMWT